MTHLLSEAREKTQDRMRLQEASRQIVLIKKAFCFFKGKVKPIFKEYPDVVSVNQLRSMLHIGCSTAYSLVQSGAIQTIRIGKKYLIPKSSVIAFAKKTK